MDGRRNIFSAFYYSSWWDTFFHGGRLDETGCRLAGWLRVAFAALVCADRLLLTLDLDHLLSPTRGLVPLWLGRHTLSNGDDDDTTMWTILGWYPNSDVFLWLVHVVGILQGLLLLLGVAPRFQLLGIYIILVSFEHHNHVIWDGEDMMFKIYCLAFMLLMPLHHITIYDSFGRRSGSETSASPPPPPSTSSWPMWPIRLFQIEVMFIYIGASLGKLNGNAWRSGYAIYFITYSTDFYPGLFNPNVIFDRLGPLKVLTWSSLYLEVSSWMLVWIPFLRRPIVLSMLLLHLGIELTMNMHCFEWLAMIGWLTFLLQPAAATKPQTESISGLDKERSWGATAIVTRLIADASILLFLAWAVVHQVPDLVPLAPSPRWVPWCETVSTMQRATREASSPFLHRIGAYSHPFDMYDGAWGWQRYEWYAELEGMARSSLPDGADDDPSSVVTVVWHSPDWLNMTIVQRKRYMRLMNYYSTLELGDGQLRRHLLRSIANGRLESSAASSLPLTLLHGTFYRLTLYERIASAPDPPSGVNWWSGPARRSPRWSERPVLTLHPPTPCRDDDDRLCQELLLRKGLPCDDAESAATCPVSCGLCKPGVFDKRDYRWQVHSPRDHEDEDDADEEEEEEEEEEEREREREKEDWSDEEEDWSDEEGDWSDEEKEVESDEFWGNQDIGRVVSDDVSVDQESISTQDEL